MSTVPRSLYHLELAGQCGQSSSVDHHSSTEPCHLRSYFLLTIMRMPKNLVIFHRGAHPRQLRLHLGFVIREHRISLFPERIHCCAVHRRSPVPTCRKEYSSRQGEQNTKLQTLCL